MILFLVFRSAQGRLARQSRALLEASRRDPLTGTLNHGALVGSLATEMERARLDGSKLGVALIDIDGFRLLNDTHGHAAGDEALQAVAGLLEARSARTAADGSLRPGRVPPRLRDPRRGDSRPIVERLRSAAPALSCRPTAERLPITVSAGLTTYPVHGASVTTLLSAAVRTLEEAKASGGDTIRVARPRQQADPASCRPSTC